MFATITRRDRLHDVLAGLEAAKQAGIGPIKVNAVLLRGVNDELGPELLRWCLDQGFELRIIEQMPLDAQHDWSREAMVTAEEILASLETEFTLTADPEHRGSAPAELFLVDGGPAKVGVIASVTRPFCGDCDRVRLTADGQVRNCLFARDESDLRAALRGDATDDEIADQWRLAMVTKRPGHGIDDPLFLQPARPMSAIGWLSEAPPSRGIAARLRPAERGIAARRVTRRTCTDPPVTAFRRTQIPRSPTWGVQESPGRRIQWGTTSFRKPRAPRKSERLSRCSSQASHTLRRSGVCSLGLFQRSSWTAGCWQPLAEQVSSDT